MTKQQHSYKDNNNNINNNYFVNTIARHYMPGIARHILYALFYTFKQIGVDDNTG